MGNVTITFKRDLTAEEEMITWKFKIDSQPPTCRCWCGADGPRRSWSLPPPPNSDSLPL